LNLGTKVGAERPWGTCRVRLPPAEEPTMRRGEVEVQEGRARCMDQRRDFPGVMDGGGEGVFGGEAEGKWSSSCCIRGDW